MIDPEFLATEFMQAFRMAEIDQHAVMTDALAECGVPNASDVASHVQGRVEVARQRAVEVATEGFWDRYREDRRG